MRLGMLLYKFLHSLRVIEAQQSSTCSHNSHIPLGGLSYWFSRRFKVAHKCSIGFESDDCAGHFKTVNSCEFSQRRTLLDVCFWIIIMLKNQIGMIQIVCMQCMNQLS